MSKFEIPEALVETVGRAIHSKFLQFYLPREGIRPATFEEAWNCTNSTLAEQTRAAITVLAPLIAKKCREIALAYGHSMLTRGEYGKAAGAADIDLAIRSHFLPEGDSR